MLVSSSESWVVGGYSFKISRHRRIWELQALQGFALGLFKVCSCMWYVAGENSYSGALSITTGSFVYGEARKERLAHCQRDFVVGLQFGDRNHNRASCWCSSL